MTFEDKIEVYGLLSMAFVYAVVVVIMVMSSSLKAKGSDTICIGLSFGTSVHERTSFVEHSPRAAHEEEARKRGGDAWIFSKVVSL
jgi:hypothetical protein